MFDPYFAIKRKKGCSNWLFKKLEYHKKFAQIWITLRTNKFRTLLKSFYWWLWTGMIVGQKYINLFVINPNITKRMSPDFQKSLLYQGKLNPIFLQFHYNAFKRRFFWNNKVTLKVTNTFLRHYQVTSKKIWNQHFFK